MTLPVVAIDGPAASGKSSTAAAVARRLGFLHVDSGALYRGVTAVALELGEGPSANRIIEAVERRGLGYHEVLGELELVLDGRPAEDLIRKAGVTAAVSRVSALGEVRSWVTGRLRALADRRRPLVMDGRDIGTTVFPDAALKVFLVASPEARAGRRLLQRGDAVDPMALSAEAERIVARDRADSSRELAPLRPANDAVILDTTHLTLADQVEQIARLAAGAGLPRAGGDR
jgi:cytidylate kinase